MLLFLSVIMSPASKKKKLQEIWEKEKLFDMVLALTLPCMLGCMVCAGSE